MAHSHQLLSEPFPWPLSAFPFSYYLLWAEEVSSIFLSFLVYCRLPRVEFPGMEGTFWIDGMRTIYFFPVH